MKQIAENRKARYEYHILECIEAGIQLVGTEVKACREHNVSLLDAYARMLNGELWLFGMHIAQYSHGNRNNHEPKRQRKLLMHKREIGRFAQATDAKGLTIVPLRLYFNRANRIKVELGLCRGKNIHDKREQIKRKLDEKEAKSAMDRHR